MVFFGRVKGGIFHKARHHEPIEAAAQAQYEAHLHQPAVSLFSGADQLGSTGNQVADLAGFKIML